MRSSVSSPVIDSSRVSQVRGMFDLPVEHMSSLEWDAELPLAERDWNIGLIVGPSRLRQEHDRGTSVRRRAGSAGTAG